jgi:glycosyltransferase involved in cell wall biosynthesis
MNSISVILCTHNPRQDYLQRAIAALKAQTLDCKDWELILVDNASDSPVCEFVDISWHQNGRFIKEDTLGLTAARLCGIRESSSDLIVFVDDDNIVRPDYLEVALKIYENWPILGVWGGRVIPEFETPPPEWTKHYWGNLAIRQFDKDQWGSSLYLLENLPCGAGLCLRRCVAEKYVDLVMNSKHQMLLGRKGSSLASAEDTVIALTACDLGYGIGMFTSLELVHIIPPNRLEENYLLRLEEGLHYSGYILNHIQGNIQKRTFKDIVKGKVYRHFKLLFVNSRERRFQMAASRGAKLAQETLRTIS